MTEQDAIARILDFHSGEASAIAVDQLLLALAHNGFNMHQWELRDHIHAMRQAGQLIASGPAGYFRPANLTEAMAYVDKQFRTPARDQLQTARIQREAAKAQFGGQLDLFGK